MRLRFIAILQVCEKTKKDRGKKTKKKNRYFEIRDLTATLLTEVCRGGSRGGGGGGTLGAEAPPPSLLGFT